MYKRHQLQTFVCGLAGYGFARFRFRGRNLLFGLLLFTIIVPPQTYISQLFRLFRFFKPLFLTPLLELFTGSSYVNLINTPLPFILPALFGMGFRSGLFIYIYRQFFRGLPGDLEDAARICLLYTSSPPERRRCCGIRPARWSCGLIC